MIKIKLQFPTIERVRQVLHIGCNHPDPRKLPTLFQTDQWKEVRFDIDPDVKPDIVGNVTDLSAIAAGSFDAVYSAHTFEHLYTHEVPIALGECLRVLMPKGCLVLRVPNLEKAAELMLKNGLYSLAYKAKSGRVRPVDIIFGDANNIQRGKKFFAHHTGFTPKALRRMLKNAGYEKLTINLGEFDIYAAAWKPEA